MPGGELACAGTTWVSVVQTHRRRGLLRRLMTGHLEDVAARGEPLAALWASEALLYRRFGYGMASQQQRFELALRPAPAFGAHAPTAEGRIRELPVKGAAAMLAPIYEAVRAQRPGMSSRTSAWWEANTLPDPTDRGGFASKRVAVFERADAGPAAYALYRTKEQWVRGGIPSGEIVVTELMGADPASEAAVWRYLLDTDLVGSLAAPHRPPDDPLPLVLEDPRRVQRTEAFDALWVRAVDLPAALTGRRWSAPADLVLRVHDPLLTANDGTWRLHVDAEGAATCERSSAAPDLELPTEAVGALYLGGTGVTALYAAGLVVEHRAGAVRDLDRAARWAPGPWSPEVF